MKIIAPIIALVLALALAIVYNTSVQKPLHVKCNLVLDFDSTITSKHLWKTLYDVYHDRPEQKSVVEWTKESRSFLNNYHWRSKNPYFPEGDENPSMILAALASPNARDFLLYIYGGQERIDKVLGFFQQLRNHSVQLDIISNGITREITTTLEQVGINPLLFRSITGQSFGPSSLKERWNSTGYHNVVSLDKLEQMRQTIITPNSKTVFIDDDYSECRYAKKELDIIVIDPSFYNGMQKQQMDEILGIFQGENCK
jgi:FMN phosphatase YigB (HAD superfamily)